MASLNVGEYLVVALTPGKHVLARCVLANKEKKKYQAVLERDSVEGTETPFDFKLSEVVAFLGRSPKPGNVYGVNVEPLRERISHSFWGEIRIFADLDDDQNKAVRSSLKAVKDKLEKMHLPKLELVTEIREQKGNMRGYYKYKPKAEKDVLCAKVDEGISEMDYVLGHEYAHGLWFRHLTPKMRMNWVRMYHDAVTLTDVTAKELKDILKEIVDEGDLRSFWKGCDDETGLVLRSVFRHIKQVHSIDRKHFELALMVGDDVSVYWPSQLELSDKKVLLTDYAKKSPEELFAETFALSFSGKKLPSLLADRLDRTLRTLVK